MPSLVLNPDNRKQLLQWLIDDHWVVACLCAAWCDVCREYRPAFDALAAQYPELRFVWIDIEDEADVVGDIDVENFPTLLIQHGGRVNFFGTVQPDVQQARRLVQAQLDRTSNGNPEVGQNANLRNLLESFNPD